MTCETAKCKLIHCKFDKLYHICMSKKRFKSMGTKKFLGTVCWLKKLINIHCGLGFKKLYHP